MGAAAVAAVPKGSWNGDTRIGPGVVGSAAFSRHIAETHSRPLHNCDGIMKPIYVGIGMTAVVGGLTLIYLASALDFLDPFRNTIMREYGFIIAVYTAAALIASVSLFYGLARSMGLADLGKRLGVVERSIRRGEGDVQLQVALRQGDEGKYPE